jgi:hypothetical protein
MQVELLPFQQHTLPLDRHMSYTMENKYPAAAERGLQFKKQLIFLAQSIAARPHGFLIIKK